MHIKWYFWLERWKNVMRHFIDEVALNLIPSSEAVNKTLATILAILIHDCIHKEGSTAILNCCNTICKFSTYRASKFLKLFYFSRYKPTGLQMTPIQILIPLTDVLFIILAMIDIFKQVQVKRNDGIVASHNKFKLGQMSICFVGSSFCLIAYGKDCGLIQAPFKVQTPRAISPCGFIGNK